MKRTTAVLCIFFLCMGSIAFGQTIPAKWYGTYYAEAKNKDGLKTSFLLEIPASGKSVLHYVSDGEAAEVYPKLKMVIKNQDQLDITFNPAYEAMGVLSLQQEGENYYFSGDPVYYINPGMERLRVKKKLKK